MAGKTRHWPGTFWSLRGDVRAAICARPGGSPRPGQNHAPWSHGANIRRKPVWAEEV